MRRPRCFRSRAVALACALALAGGLASTGCARRETPGAGLPPGALFVARTAALARLLATAAALEGTPLARRANELAARLPACAWLEAQGPDAGALVSQLACGDPAGALAALHRERRDHDLAFALPLRGGARLVGSAQVGEDGSLGIALALPGDAIEGPAAFLLPGSRSAGGPLLSSSEQLVHARVRAENRLDLASFVEAESQASLLFALESELFSGLVLDGSWEAAVYLPEAGRPSPRVALALGFRERAPAVAAIEAFVETVRTHWPVQRSPFSVGRSTGACLLDLNLLPDLAPCYVATDRALIAGWNAASVRKALDGGSDERASTEGLDGPGALLLDFARVEEADAQLRALAPQASPLPPQPYPWSRLTVRGERASNVVRLRARLEAKGGA